MEPQKPEQNFSQSNNDLIEKKSIPERPKPELEIKEKSSFIKTAEDKGSSPVKTTAGKEKKPNKGLIITLIILAFVTVAVLALAGYFYITWQNNLNKSKEQKQEVANEEKKEKEAEKENESKNEENTNSENRSTENQTKDSDSDGLTDIKERQLGTDPKKADTDDDGYNDKQEVDSGYDPLSPAANGNNNSPDSKKSTSLIQPENLVYQGAFRMPQGEEGDNSAKSWGWGGSALTYYPKGDPSGSDDGYPGSLYGTGHEQYQYVSEISIPTPVKSKNKNLADLSVAKTLQGFQDIRTGLMGSNVELGRVGLAYLAQQKNQDSDKIYFAFGQHLQEDNSNIIHGFFNLDLSNPQIQGGWIIDDQSSYSTGDYIFEIPQDWADKNTPGKLLVTGRYRDGGWSGQGPSLFAYGPWNDGNPPAKGTKISATSLLKYETSYDKDALSDKSAKTMTNYQHSDEWSGGSWLTKSEKEAVISVGTKGMGNKYWYGNQTGECLECENRGWWSESFQAQIIFYNPQDLASVASGKKESYEPQPYATLNLNSYLYNKTSDQQKSLLGDCSFDRENGILYVFEMLGDKENNRPLVHVFKIN